MQLEKNISYNHTNNWKINISVTTQLATRFFLKIFKKHTKNQKGKQHYKKGRNKITRATAILTKKSSYNFTCNWRNFSCELTHNLQNSVATPTCVWKKNSVATSSATRNNVSYNHNCNWKNITKIKIISVATPLATDKILVAISPVTEKTQLQPHLQLGIKSHLQPDLQLEKKSQLQLNLQLKKISVATRLATEKKISVATRLATEKNLSCNPTCN